MQDEMVSSNFPQIPPRLESLYDNEANSDIEFVVGPEWDQWRFPAHQSVMCKNPVFHAMLEGPLATDEKSITIRDVDGRAFDLLLRHIYGQKVEFRTYDHALATIYAANKYLCPELVKCCVIYLDKEINDETVMFIYRQLRLFASTFTEISPDNPFAFSSAPPAEDIEGIQVVDDQRERSGEMMTTYCTSLLYNCYHYIDTNAEGLLKSDALEDLDHDQLLDIVKRDRLRINSEIILFDALMRWCIQQCKRRQMELTVENRRIVLGNDLIFSVRYLLMSLEEFLNGPALSGILHSTDISILLARIEGVPLDPNITSPQLSDNLLYILAKPRNAELYSPFPLSERSKKIISKDLKLEVSKKKKKDKKKAKDAKKRNSRHEEDEEERESRCFNYTLNILSTIFD